jgi:uncharacterized protein
MKIRIDDISEGGLTINATTDDDEWLKIVVTEVIGKQRLLEDDSARLNLQLFRTEKNVTLIGGIILKFHPACDRCAVVFQKQQQVPIHLLMSPVYINKNGKKDDSSTEDEDVSFYTNDEINIADITKEHLILAQEMVNVCNEECKGLCQTCGKNLNKGPCRCKKLPRRDSPFAILKKIHT